MRFVILVYASILFIFSNCGDNSHRLIIRNSSWPDGSSISIIADNRVLSRMSLYGNRTQGIIPGNTNFRVRAASKGYITYLSDEYQTDDFNKSISLPQAIKRKSIGSWRFGLDFSGDVSDSLYMEMIPEVHGSLSTVTIELLNNPEIDTIVKLAHSHSIEVAASVSLTPAMILDTNYALSDSAELYCVDFVVIQGYERKFIANNLEQQVHKLLMTLHERGIPIAFEVNLPSDSGKISLPLSIVQLFANVPSNESPDELRIQFQCDGTPPTLAAETIADKYNELSALGIPLSRVSTALPLTAFKFHVMNDGGLQDVEAGYGELQKLVNGPAGRGLIRMKDNSLRLGYKGSLFAYEDFDAIADKVRIMRQGICARSGGIHMQFDGRGIHPTVEGIKRVANIAAGK